MTAAYSCVQVRKTYTGCPLYKLRTTLYSRKPLLRLRLFGAQDDLIIALQLALIGCVRVEPTVTRLAHARATTGVKNSSRIQSTADSAPSTTPHRKGLRTALG